MEEGASTISPPPSPLGLVAARLPAWPAGFVIFCSFVAVRLEPKVSSLVHWHEHPGRREQERPGRAENPLNVPGNSVHRINLLDLKHDTAIIIATIHSTGRARLAYRGCLAGLHSTTSGEGFRSSPSILIGWDGDFGPSTET